MTLTSIKTELMKAQLDGYIIPLFDVFEFQGVEGLMDALVGKRAPTIMGIYSPFAAQPNCRAFAAYIRSRAEDTDIPISIMLDHGASVEQCLEVLKLGFTDVMYDGSKLPLEENIANTRRVVEAAHELGVAVEAELGHVGMGDEYAAFGAQRAGFTDPESVEYFVEETGVDFLAVAFGNAHGVYQGEPRLDFDLVAEIRRRVDLPLVMHGGTGISDAQFQMAIQAGISKVNYFTNIMHTAVHNMRAAASKPQATMADITLGIQAAYYQWGKRMYEVFRTAGKA